MSPSKFSTLHIPEQHREEFLVEEFGRRVTKAEVILDDPNDCILSARNMAVRDIGLLQTSISSSLQIIRDQKTLKHFDDRLTLVIADGHDFIKRDRNDEYHTIKAEDGTFVSHNEKGGTVSHRTSHSVAISMQRVDLDDISDDDVARLAHLSSINCALIPYLKDVMKSVLNNTNQSDELTTYSHTHIAELMNSIITQALGKHFRQYKDHRLLAVIEQIEKNVDNPYISAFSIAKKLNCSVRHIHHLLEETGKSFSQHVACFRIEKAKRALKTSDTKYTKISDISMQVGFSDLSYFNRVFKKHVGCTPSEYRDRF